MVESSSSRDMRNKCPGCCGSVYPNDGQIRLEHLWHKSCFKCAQCKCQLTLSNFSYDAETLLCKTHYLSRFHQSNSYAGGEKFAKSATSNKSTTASSISTVLKMEELTMEKRSPTTTGQNGEVSLPSTPPPAPVMANEIDGEDNPDCSSPIVDTMDSTISPSVAPEEQSNIVEARAEDDVGVVTEDDATPISSTTEDVLQDVQTGDVPNNLDEEKNVSPVSSRIRQFSPKNSEKTSVDGCEKEKKVKKVFKFGGSPKCTSCAKSVYPNDGKIQMKDQVWHGSCFKCSECTCQLNLNNFAIGGDILFCKTHYLDHFHKNNGYAGGDQFKRQ